ncbi:hypothetical protein DL89DRAFT_42916 [Linderina pennispora]|uniref:Transmembrane protein n=1 Tax=Linderina pennispora TaxID=61395 RepID=A0A1Y1VS99_9FUNG|nr:uncharacterized protein DL89DRAFT_42916 [Linderina pennispora]ORX64172.1 hypothetical protein DL89DRAFT_42916 [Linderina pennispora]
MPALPDADFINQPVFDMNSFISTVCRDVCGVPPTGDCAPFLLTPSWSVHPEKGAEEGGRLFTAIGVPILLRVSCLGRCARITKNRCGSFSCFAQRQKRGPRKRLISCAVPLFLSFSLCFFISFPFSSFPGPCFFGAFFLEPVSFSYLKRPFVISEEPASLKVAALSRNTAFIWRAAQKVPFTALHQNRPLFSCMPS